MKDLIVINELEREIGKKITQVKSVDIFRYESTVTAKYEIDSSDNVVKLKLFRTKLKKVPESLFKLTNIVELSLWDNEFCDIPPDINKLKKLEILNLVNNTLKFLPIELFNLINLKHLDLSYNRIKEINGDISKLHKLENLYLYHNSINSIPIEISCLSNLKNLNLDNNKIRKIPKEILDMNIDINLEASEGLTLSGNPIEIPPIEIIGKGKKAIRDYYLSLENDEQVQLNESRVLIVGDADSGKTSLLNRLKNKQFNENETLTHGINIEEWKVAQNGYQIKARVWDFGGQDIMLATHQFFLAKRCLYILVLDSRKEEKTEHWLKYIESFGGDSPVIIVINKIDENPDFDVNRIFLSEKYKNIIGFHKISCKTTEGLEEFINSLKEEICKYQHSLTAWSRSWLNVKEWLESKIDSYITYNQYQSICAIEGVPDKSSQETLVEYLHDLGIVLHFKDFSLFDTYVLESAWVTKAVYKILTCNEIRESHGELKFESLVDILDKKSKDDYFYPQDRHSFIVELMKKFELCYEIDTNKVLIPDLLDIQEPIYNFDNNDSMKIIINYDFLPRSIMPRLIVRLHNDINNNLKWRTGVCLKSECFGAEAVIKVDYDAKKMYLHLNGEGRNDYFSAIRYELANIHSRYSKINAREMIPCNCNQCTDPGNSVYYHDYSVLLKYKKNGIKKVPCALSASEIKIQTLISNYDKVDLKQEEEIIAILKEIRKKVEDEQTFLEEANKIIIARPNVFGFGVNLNALAKKWFCQSNNVYKED